MAEVKYKRPGWFTQNFFNRPIQWLSRLGISPAGAETLAVRGRKSGQIRTNPVNPFEIGGRTYLLAPRGTTEWVRNLRAAGEGELRKGSRARRFRADELARTAAALERIRNALEQNVSPRLALEVAMLEWPAVAPRA